MGKAIFIGLGGAGVYPTGHLKAKMLFDFYQGDAAKMGLDCQFIFIDTDDKAINDLNEEYGKRLGGGRDFISYEERVNLGDVNPFATYWQATNPGGNLTAEQRHFLSWVDKDSVKDLKSQQLKKGASANRQQGRIAVWSRWNYIEVKVRSAMRILDNIRDVREYETSYPTFYIMSGTCGGTGSSAFLDTAFIIDRLFRDRFPFDPYGDPTIRAVLFMPYWYIDYYKSKQAAATTVENYQSNGYAFFDEVEAVLADRWILRDGKKFLAAAARKSTRKEEFPLFNIAFCIDSQTERGYSVSQQQMYRNSAELLYYWHLGSAQNSMISQRDNEERPVVRPGDPVPMFATIGYRALRFPEELMEEYFKKRFLYELFENGVLGEKYGDAVTDEQVRNEHVQRTFHKCIARYLFANSQEQNIPNMETVRREKLQSKIEFFDLSRFKREGKDAIDPNKVVNTDLLDELDDDAESITRQIKDEFKQEFEESGGTTSLENILRMVRGGYREATGKFGSLEDEIEDSILRYGLKYAQAFAGRIDNICEEQVQRPGSDNDLMDRIDSHNRRLKDLEGEIAGARKRCQEVRSGKREEAIWELYGKLRERIEKKSEIAILEQQIIVLNKLSEGEQGIIDDYERGIADLITQTQNKIDEKERGVKGAYTTYLPGRFMATREDVTTTYLPPVVQFVEQGEWARGHLFDVLYRRIVEHINDPSVGAKPRRYGSDFGRAASRKGLHAVLWEMLTQRTYTDYEGGYEVDSHTSFFRKAFSHYPPEKSSVEILSELEKIADKYIDLKASQEEEIRKERNKSLLERFNAIENDDDKKWIISQFNEVGTQTFCPMEGAEGTIYSVYAGPDEALAIALGYRPGDASTHQFVPDDTRNRLVRIKMITQQTLRRYPHYRDLQSIYSSVKDGRATERMLFAPHIHRVFNKVGAQRGLAQVALDTPEQRLRLFTSMLMYRELCEKAFNDSRILLDQILEIDPAYRGQEKRLATPLFVGENANGQRIARVCSKLERALDGRMQLLERNYITVSYNANNFAWIFADMENYVTVYAACAEFDDYFKTHAASEWIPLLDAAKKSLLAKIGLGLNVDVLKSFHEDLSNKLVNVYQELQMRLAANTFMQSSKDLGSPERPSVEMDALSVKLAI